LNTWGWRHEHHGQEVVSRAPKKKFLSFAG